MLPLVRVRTPPKYTLCGTGFLLRNGRGLGVTAAHVAEDLLESEGTPAAMFRTASRRLGYANVLRFDIHPTEDVALFRLPDDDYKSQYVITPERHNASDKYQLWGYPEDIYHDQLERDGVLIAHLVFSSGDVRRRVSYGMPHIRGSMFYELSTPAGRGCSGSAVAINSDWRVGAVYVGERRNDAGTFAVGYATRSEVLAERWPLLVGGERRHMSSLCPLP